MYVNRKTEESICIFKTLTNKVFSDFDNEIYVFMCFGYFFSRDGNIFE